VQLYLNPVCTACCLLSHHGSPLTTTNTFLDIIDVDTVNPERNREVTVYSVRDMEGVQKNVTYDGYFICLPMDLRWVAENVNEDQYRARLWTTGQVMITYPAYDYSHLNDYRAFQKSEAVTEPIAHAMDNAAEEFIRDTNATKGRNRNRQWKKLILNFPNGHVLSSKALYSEAGDDEELETEFVSVPVNQRDMGIGDITYACWKVARTDTKSRKKGRTEAKVHQSKNAAMLAKLKKAKGDSMMP